MIKVILFDGDGVIINKPMLFSEHLAKDYDVSYEEAILPFFKNEFQLCLTGKADLKEVIKPYLSKWNWDKSIDELLEYWFKNENFVDKRITDLIIAYRTSGIKCYLHSNQEKYRTDYMKDVMGLGEFVEDIFSSAYLGVKKPEPQFWQSVFDKIQPVSKEEVLVWDDDKENVESAKAFGFNAEFYNGYDSFIETMKKYIKP